MIEGEVQSTIVDGVVQANLKDSDYSELCHLLKTGLSNKRN